jgi:acetoin utilization protein AcuB
MAEPTVRLVARVDAPRVGPDTSLDEVEQLMRRERVRHVPVVEGEHLVGLVSEREILDALLASPTCDPASVPVERVMRRDPWTAIEATTLREAARRMLRYRIGCLPIVAPGDRGPILIGMLSEADLLRAAYRPEAAP